MTNPSGGDHEATLKYLRENNASPEYQMAYEKHVADLNQTNAKTASDQLATKKDTEDRSAQIISQATDALKNSPDTFPDLWATQLRPAYESVNPKAKDLPTDHVPTEADLNGALARHATQSFSINKTEEQRKASKEQRDITQFGQTQEAENRTKDAAMLASAIRQGPQAFAEALGSLPPERSRAFASLTAEAKPEDALRIGQTANEQVTTGLTASGQAQTKAHETAMEANERRRIAIEQGNANIKSKEFEANYGPGSNQAVSGLPPAQKNAALKAASEVEKGYVKESSLSNDINDMIQSVRNGGPGSQEAGAQLGKMIAGELNGSIGIRRMNPADAAAAATPGSFLQTLGGKVSRIASGGAPMTEGVLKDIEAFNNSIADKAKARRSQGLSGVDQTYHSGFAGQPSTAAPKPSATAAPSVPEIASQADYDKLPKGARYTNGGVPHVKQ